MSDKLDKDIYYMTLAFNVSRRSIDPSTKHGAVIVSKDGRILSTGYNGPIKQVEDTKVPTTRPEKYKHFLHAEENSVINYYGSAQDIDGATIYITGLPCPNCVRMCLQKGITTLVFAPIMSKMLDKSDQVARDLMLEYQTKDIKFREMDIDQIKQVLGNLDDIKDYIQLKTEIDNE